MIWLEVPWGEHGTTFRVGRAGDKQYSAGEMLWLD